ncbi:hypothetical protein EDB89DRAFT_2076965 [Lactarius sanguifluus]|nr:hypothetical protein EDB89DRAFT_2076965 [Lactarius sanguifluus]
MARDGQIDNVTLNHPCGFSTDAEKAHPSNEIQVPACPISNLRRVTRIMKTLRWRLSTDFRRSLSFRHARRPIRCVGIGTSQGQKDKGASVATLRPPTGRRGRAQARWRASDPGGFVFVLNKIAPPPKHLRLMTLALSSRSPVWYQCTVHLGHYTGALRLLKVSKPSGGRRRSPYIYRYTFLGLLFTRQSSNIPALQPAHAEQASISRPTDSPSTACSRYKRMDEAPATLLRTTLIRVPHANRTDVKTFCPEKASAEGGNIKEHYIRTLPKVVDEIDVLLLVLDWHDPVGATTS